MTKYEMCVRLMRHWLAECERYRVAFQEGRARFIRREMRSGRMATDNEAELRNEWLKTDRGRKLAGDEEYSRQNAIMYGIAALVESEEMSRGLVGENSGGVTYELGRVKEWGVN